MVTTLGLELLTKKNPHHLLRALLTRHNVKETFIFIELFCKDTLFGWSCHKVQVTTKHHLCQLGCLCEHVASLPMQITRDQYQIINTYSSLLINMYKQPQ